MDYYQARTAFFQEFKPAEREIIHLINTLTRIVSRHIYKAYLNKLAGTKISSALEKVGEQMVKAAHAANEFGLAEEVKNYQSWHKQILNVLTEVDEVLLQAEIEFDVFGRKNKSNYFIGTKLPIDSAIIAIEYNLDSFYKRDWILRKRRIYHGAGLLYYLGYEKHEDLLPEGAPFPDRLTREDEIHNRYFGRRKEAKKYLTHDKVKAFMKEATNRKD